MCVGYWGVTQRTRARFRVRESYWPLPAVYASRAGKSPGEASNFPTPTPPPQRPGARLLCAQRWVAESSGSQLRGLAVSCLCWTERCVCLLSSILDTTLASGIPEGPGSLLGPVRGRGRHMEVLWGRAELGGMPSNATRFHSIVVESPG